MRVVLTAHPIYSHLVPFVLPVGQLLRRAGHDVVVATGAAGAEYVERAALPALVLPHVVTISEVMRKALADESGRAETLGFAFGPSQTP